MKRRVKAVFGQLQAADFIMGSELALSPLLEEILSKKVNIRKFIMDQLGFDAGRSLSALFDAYVVISSAA